MKTVTLQFDFDDAEFDEFMNSEECQGDIYQWAFGEICQNHGFGFLVSCHVVEKEQGQ